MFGRKKQEPVIPEANYNIVKTVPVPHSCDTNLFPSSRYCRKEGWHFGTQVQCKECGRLWELEPGYDQGMQWRCTTKKLPPMGLRAATPVIEEDFHDLLDHE